MKKDKNLEIKNKKKNNESEIQKNKSNPSIIKRKPYAKTQSNAGARCKLEEHQDEIISRTREGLSKKDRVAGLICDKTYNEWINSGNLDIDQGIISQYSQFCFKIRKAEKEFRKELIECIRNQAPEDWKAAVWLIERSDPDTYKLKDKMEVQQQIEVSQKAFLELPDNGRRTIKDSD